MPTAALQIKTPRAIKTAPAAAPPTAKAPATAGDARIVEAVTAALASQRQFIEAVILAGQMLVEKREAYISRHNGGNIRFDDPRHYLPHQNFADWLKATCPDLSERTAQRWMAAASTTMRHISRLPPEADAPVSVKLGAAEHLISDVITGAADDPPGAAQFRQKFTGFLAEKTLSEVAETGLVGMNRALNGKTAGGARGEDRRAYHQHFATHFKEMSNILRRWDTLQKHDPGQHAKMTETIRAVIMGGPVKIKHGVPPVDLKPWPVSFTRLIVAIAKDRLREAQ